MTALERARAFIQHDAVRTALVIVPLAMSGAANAGLVFLPASGDKTPTAEAAIGLTGTPSVASSNFEPFGVGGLKWWGSTNVLGFSSFTSGGDAIPVECESGPAPGCSISLTLEGTVTGQFEMGIALHWDFGLESTGSVTKVRYSVEYSLNDTVVGTSSFDDIGFGTNGNLTAMGLSPGTNVTTWKVVLTTMFEAEGGGTVQLVVPDRTVEIAPPSAQSIPEPSSVTLAFLAFTGLAALRRRRRS